MLNPTDGQLVGGISRSLRSDVLPGLPEGSMRRQLKAALHALDRVEKSWDQYTQALIDDNQDIYLVLSNLIASLLSQEMFIPDDILEIFQKASKRRKNPAESDDILVSLRENNAFLQEALVRVDPWLRGLNPAQPAALSALIQLYRRMVAREIMSMATSEIPEQELLEVLAKPSKQP